MTTDKKIIAFSALIIAFSILYYFVYFIPNRDKRDFLLSREKECLKLHSDHVEYESQIEIVSLNSVRAKYIATQDKCYGEYTYGSISGSSGKILEHFSDTNVANYGEIYERNFKTGNKDIYQKRVAEIFEE